MISDVWWFLKPSNFNDMMHWYGLIEYNGLLSIGGTTLWCGHVGSRLEPVAGGNPPRQDGNICISILVICCTTLLHIEYMDENDLACVAICGKFVVPRTPVFTRHWSNKSISS